ncbi:MAG: hypothetical protein ACI91G_000671, partial [Gammaproteobacteria bacterium]
NELLSLGGNSSVWLCMRGFRRKPIKPIFRTEQLPACAITSV